ncbi:23S rRNA (adenine(1618)-N(6))-methyltransferase RlmF [Bizionia arctica]|uniref:23S rRNA (adenine(1618)-N(6))-methyltransferase RlmF n=1 Tax=Bizionia arctica TaxID=1495645 RepID=UPI001666049A|nr:23S rRNA (adenine(1618)-N(6))-methyltransferase RlmF [Bizionia arctica]
MKTTLHSKNKHASGYDFHTLCKVYKDLEPFVFVNSYETQTIDFSNPKAVKALNTALLFAYYHITYWEFSDQNLCPPIPGRVDYIHHLATLLSSSGIKENIQVLDVGTGATCIYPLLGNAVYDWQFLASDVDKDSLENAQVIIDKNRLSDKIKLIFQAEVSQILKGIFNTSDKLSATMCNPPFFKSEAEAIEATTRKLKGLGKPSETLVRNFGGTSNELWYEGGEKAFLHTYLYESSFFKEQCFWFTTLVSNNDHVRSMKVSLKKLGATEVKVIQMTLGNKISRIVAWTFLTKEQQKDWN